MFQPHNLELLTELRYEHLHNQANAARLLSNLNPAKPKTGDLALSVIGELMIHTGLRLKRRATPAAKPSSLPTFTITL